MRVTWDWLRDNHPEIYAREREKELAETPGAGPASSPRRPSARKARRSTTGGVPGGSPIPTPDGTDLARSLAPDAPGWRVPIPLWQPPSLNEYLGGHFMRVAREKAAVAEVVGGYFLKSGVPAATGRRRVSIALRTPRPGRFPDHSNLLKALEDGLTACGAIIDDGDEYLKTGDYYPSRGPQLTIIILEDLYQ